MFANYFRLTLRNLAKNKVSFFINLAGMSIALGCCIAAYVNYEFNAGFDKQQKNASQLYRISFIHEADGKETPYGVAPMPVGDLVRANFNEVDQVVRYIRKDARFRIGTEMFQKEFAYADPNFTELFSIDLLSGSLDLKEKSHVLISDKLAKTYYGHADVVGKELTQIIGGETREFVIGGVYKAFPFNSSFRFDLLTGFDNYFTDPRQQSAIAHDWKRWTTVFLYIRDPHVIGRVTTQLQQYIKPQNEARLDLLAKRFYVEPFIGMPSRAIREKNEGHWLNLPMPPAAVIAPFVMAGFLLLVACFNFTNNSISMAGRRLKEIGIRKVIGGNRRELIVQFLSESLVFCMIAMVVALFLAEYFVAGWDAMWPSLEFSIRYRDNMPMFWMLAGLMTATALLAGSYPAFYISSFKPIHVLKGTTRFGGTNLFTKILLVFQFSISLMAVIFAIAFYFNSKFQKNFDLGYAYHSVVQVPVENENQFLQLKNALSSHPLIHSIGGSEHHIYGNTYQAAVKSDREEKEVDMLNIGDDYFNTVNVRILAGREFKKESASDARESIIVNEEFVRAFNLGKDPLGKRIMINDTSQHFIVGIVKDVYLQALFQPLAPLVFKYVPPSSYRYLVASTDPKTLLEMNDQIKAEWKKIFPMSLYTGRLMEERMIEAMSHFDNVVILYTFMGLVAIIMSISGLYSLVSLHLQKRTKELGIRKVLGAPLSNIALLSSKLFLIVMLISFVVGSVFGSLMVNKLMDTIWEYYEAINAQVIFLAVGMVMGIATVTVSFKIFAVSRANPTDSLRHE